MESSPQAIHQRGGQDGTSPRQDGPSGAPLSLALDIARLWGEHLNRPEVGVEDDFFTLGGNSLTGIKIIDRVAQDYGVQLSVRDFYLAQTPARVAQLIEQGRAAA
ncbi:phosphopantetheine-binding protein [Streptomyces resistomycificus]|uniref:Phosphopantetheine-binding protein n=1 Tax=Streptomyces resistomycificus TaxID=67356 RepID=A0A0L8L3F7_9ACTN|nr:phosphopantetheine-binding protein [Streptomyces resistomycificus]KOG32635.1 phosphopantetheine-binding protein [Streptomyces resistomycificus]KUN90575.1 phosphopantetheine-binding protein [Streptomyces resistomycificus]